MKRILLFLLVFIIIWFGLFVACKSGGLEFMVRSGMAIIITFIIVNNSEKEKN